MAILQVRVLRVKTPNEIIVQEIASHSVLTLHLSTPIPSSQIAEARLTSVFRPVPATVRVGPWEDSKKAFVDSFIQQVQWHQVARGERIIWQA